uniref:Uncharacterized protein n=1 Tax=Pseudomonas phage HRDY3 TaxID=3236930 RepID=A0AB39CE92_9VIRU
MAEVLINYRKAKLARERAEKAGIKPGVGVIVTPKDVRPDI